MLEAYFQPIDFSLLGHNEQVFPSDALGNTILGYFQEGKFPDFENAKIALIGVGDDRGNPTNRGADKGMDKIRKEFYNLKVHQHPQRIIDLGNIKQGATLEDTYAAIATVIYELIPMKVIPIILGGTQDLTYGHYAGYKKLEQIINIVSIDSRFDLGNPEDTVNANTFLGKIILEQPNYLFNYSNIGYQTYYVGTESVDLMKKLYFDTYRLGQVRDDIQETEPIVRNADLVTVDLSVIRQSDAPGNAQASPNGFFGEEICQILMYAGISDKLSGYGAADWSGRQ